MAEPTKPARPRALLAAGLAMAAASMPALASLGDIERRLYDKVPPSKSSTPSRGSNKSKNRAKNKASHRARMAQKRK